MYKQYLKTKKNTNTDRVLSVHISHVDVAITPKAQEKAPDRVATGALFFGGSTKAQVLRESYKYTLFDYLFLCLNSLGLTVLLPVPLAYTTCSNKTKTFPLVGKI